MQPISGRPGSPAKGQVPATPGESGSTVGLGLTKIKAGLTIHPSWLVRTDGRQASKRAEMLVVKGRNRQPQTKARAGNQTIVPAGVRGADDEERHRFGAASQAGKENGAADHRLGFSDLIVALTVPSACEWLPQNRPCRFDHARFHTRAGLRGCPAYFQGG